MVEKSLRQQFGGRITTLKEAATDQGAAAQYTKQVQLLMSGPTKLADTEGEAHRILEAMAKGTTAETGGTLDAQQAVAKSVDVGNDIQERNYNQLIELGNKLELANSYTSIIANNTSRTILGGGGEKEAGARKEASLSASSRKIMRGEDHFAKEAGIDIQQTLLEHGKQLGSISGLAGNLLDKGNDLVNSLQNKADEMKNNPEDVRDKKSKLKEEQINQDVPKKLNRVNSDINAGTEQGKTSFNRQDNSSTLSVENITTCPACQKKEMTKTAEVVFDGKIEDLIKNQTKHAHTG